MHCTCTLFAVSTSLNLLERLKQPVAQKCRVLPCWWGHGTRRVVRAVQGPLGPRVEAIFPSRDLVSAKICSAHRWRDANRLGSQGKSIPFLETDTHCTVWK